MASEYIYLKGKGSWIRPHQLNEWGKWAMVLHPDNEGLEIIRNLQAEGVKNEIKKDDDGWHVRLGRPGEITVKGVKRGMKPPMVWDGSRPLPDGQGFMPFPPDKLIGNGSDVVVKMEVYSHGVKGSPGKKAKAMRWESVRVDNLIPYDAPKDMLQDQKEDTASYNNIPKQSW